MSTGSGPPPRPPQISPDGKWVWNGRQWLPVARRESVFPAWSVATEQAAPAPTVVKVEPEPEPIRVIGPEGEEIGPEEPEQQFNPYDAYVEPAPAKIAWERPQTGFNKYLYVAAGVVVLVMAAIVLNSIGPIQLPWMATATVPAKPSPTPPLKARSESAQADQLLTGYLAPPFTSLAQSETLLNEVCSGILTFSCRDAMRETDTLARNVLSVIDHQTAVACIAASVVKLRADVAAMDTALKLALQAYGDNKVSELTQGLAGYNAAIQAIVADWTTATAIQKSVCNPVQTGP